MSSVLALLIVVLIIGAGIYHLATGEPGQLAD
jgi:hypothetical protein